ncbi:calcium uniporter protein 2, mitochondrial-like isoform X2 [Musa acuminata AAA Group]|uniref:calcium uniporter protein 2, mitochondrial-like isoform X2 n=1 Tax=Musa acuminata AAA Group TaxID=214697 RepID=UPI0031DA3D1E
MSALRRNLARLFTSLRRPFPAATPASVQAVVCRPSFFQPALPPDRTEMPVWGDRRLAERIRGLCPDRISLDEKRVSLEEIRKVVRASQVAAARERLGATGESSVAYREFVRICCEASCSEQGLEMARSLDESGVVIVIGNIVFLRPEEVVKSIENMIPFSSSNHHSSQREELRKMEEEKAEIDRRAASQVRKELWCGMVFVVAQTAALMRATFWELSWDVMEPICFYLTSIYFMAGYAFFIRTSKEPSFEGFFTSRFATKQKRLMKARNFDLTRFNELSQACLRSPPLSEFTSPSRAHHSVGRRSDS